MDTMYCVIINTAKPETKRYQKCSYYSACTYYHSYNTVLAVPPGQTLTAAGHVVLFFVPYYYYIIIIVID
jgi:hypothetical protein